LGLAASVFGGYTWYQHKLEQDELERVINTKILPPPHEWEKQPLVDDQLNQWQVEIESEPMVYEGWDLKKVKFSPDRAVLSYMRNEMLSADSFSRKVYTHFNVYPVFDKNGNAAKITLKINSIKTYGNNEELLSGTNVSMKFFSYFQSLGINNITLKKEKVTLPPVPDSNDPDVVYKWGQVDWQKFKWSVDINIPPSVLLYGLEPLPGLRIDSMSSSNVSGTSWKLEGDFYAKEK
ncbi:hypothetical protein DVQ78_19575, partial [Yersinia enterocolitica]|nr:hypothetical protein [Yersinia enterocolitica]